MSLNCANCCVEFGGEMTRVTGFRVPSSGKGGQGDDGDDSTTLPMSTLLNDILKLPPSNSMTPTFKFCTRCANVIYQLHKLTRKLDRLSGLDSQLAAFYQDLSNTDRTQQTIYLDTSESGSLFPTAVHTMSLMTQDGEQFEVFNLPETAEAEVMNDEICLQHRDLKDEALLQADLTDSIFLVTNVLPVFDNFTTPASFNPMLENLLPMDDLESEALQNSSNPNMFMVATPSTSAAVESGLTDENESSVEHLSTILIDATEDGERDGLHRQELATGCQESSQEILPVAANLTDIKTSLTKYAFKSRRYSGKCSECDHVFKRASRLLIVSHMDEAHGRRKLEFECNFCHEPLPLHKMMRHYMSHLEGGEDEREMNLRTTCGLKLGVDSATISPKHPKHRKLTVKQVEEVLRLIDLPLPDRPNPQEIAKRFDCGIWSVLVLIQQANQDKEPDSYTQHASELFVHHKERNARRAATKRSLLFSHKCTFAGCNKVWEDRDKWSLRRHVDLHHKYTSPVVCDICGKPQPTPSHLRRHIVTHMNQAEREKVRDKDIPPVTHACPICDKTLTTSYSLNLHMRVHLDPEDRKFQCDQCAYSCIDKVSFQRHLRLFHSEEEPESVFQCTRCPETFRFRRHLREHAIICCDPVERPNLCPIRDCRKRFKRKQQLETHLRDLHECSKEEARRFAYPNKPRNKRSTQMQLYA